MPAGRIAWMLVVGSVLVVGCSSARPGAGAVSPPVVQQPGSGPAAAPVPTPTGPQPVVSSPASPPTPPDKREGHWLYPAYVVEQGKQVWGYLGRDGQFAIRPQFDAAADFGPDGLAIVTQNRRYGLINQAGQLVAPAEYDWISSEAAGFAHAGHRGEHDLVPLDEQGPVLAGAAGIAGPLVDGLAPIGRTVQGKERYGYVDKSGAVVIEPQYEYVQGFQEGTAVVKLPDGPYAVIDTTGRRISTLAYEYARGPAEGLLLVRDKVAPKFGYVSVTGEVLIPPRFDAADLFADGFAVVGMDDPTGQRSFGLINRRGEYVIPATNTEIERILPGIYAVVKQGKIHPPERYLPHALVNAEGKQLTDFVYYDVQMAGPDLISATDDTSTFLLDRSGHKVADLPTLTGIGTMRLQGDRIKAEVDGELRYLTRDGKTVWESPRSRTLAGGIQVQDRKYRSDRFLLVHYPELAGLPDPQVQASINGVLRSIFVDDLPLQKGRIQEGQYTSSVQVDFGVEPLGRLLKVHRTGYAYPIGAAHGVPIDDWYHFDTRSGARYTLADLFRKESGYQARLADLVSKQIAKLPARGLAPHPEIRADQSFILGPESLTIYFQPYEIGPYAAGMPTFEIPYQEIMDLIDTQDAFWKSFH